MIANFLDYFYSDIYDERVIINDLTVKELKEMVLTKIQTLSENTIPAELNCLEFIIEILARIFVEEDIKLDETNKAKARTITEFPAVDPTKVFVLFKTSGSCGEKKTIKKSLQNLLNESKNLISEFEFPEDLTFISTTTPKHLFGFTFHFMLALNCAKLLTDEITIPEDINTKNTCLITTPSFLEKMQKYNNTPVIKPSFIFSAGSALKPTVFKFAQDIADNVIDIYGSTETGIIAHRETSTENFKLFKSIQIEPKEDSTLVYTAYSAVSPVLINDKLTINNNKIKIEGRTDRTFKIQEKRVNAAEIEALLNKTSLIDDCYVFQHKDKLACLTVLSQKGQDYFYKNGVVELTKSLKSTIKNCFEIIPQKWKFTDEIPKTNSGKIDREEIEKLFGLNLSIPLIVEKQADSNSARIKLFFYRNCNFFKGHFDNFPLVPGVVQLYLAQYFSKKLFNTELCGQSRKLKFSNIIKPDKFIDLELELLSNSISYKFVDETHKYSSGILGKK